LANWFREGPDRENSTSGSLGKTVAKQKRPREKATFNWHKSGQRWGSKKTTGKRRSTNCRESERRVATNSIVVNHEKGMEMGDNRQKKTKTRL